MNISQTYIILSVAVLILIGLAVFLIRGRKPEKKLTKLAALSFCFVIAGIVFGESRIIGYSLMGFGVLLALVDIANKLKK
ncbi:MAG: hypothetical protein ABH800_00950 [Candidatus Nealsonbacteria bacterium]